MIAESRKTHTSDGGDIDGAVKVSHLNLVDLAGSERPSVTGAEGLRLKEGGFINRSLFALGNVINKLSEGESFFVPFRDSKLTRILQNSLGGNTKTSIICAITPASADETLSTLQFASRAKRIQNKPKVNEVLDESAMLKRYRKEINELKNKLEKSHTREEVLKREFELRMEKDKEETKAKLFKLTKLFCTAPKDIEPRQQRQQRRWTLCPAAAHRNPFQLDVKFNSDLPSWRMEQTFAGSPSRDCEEFKIEKLNVTIEEKLRKSSGSSSEWCETQGGLFETEKKMKTEEEEIRSLKKQLEVQEFENTAVSNSEKDKNITELNHSLFTIREEVEQKQSVIDEKEIEILEKVGIIEQLQEKLAAVQHTATTQEVRNVELQANVEEKSRKIAELEEWCETQGGLFETEKKMKTEEEEENRSLKKQLEDVQCSLENAAVSNSEKDKNITELNHSLFTIREKVEQKQFVIDEKEIEILEKVGMIEQLQEKLAAVQHTATSQGIRSVELQSNVEEKSRKIAELERNLVDVNAKDAKIFELELELDVLQEECKGLKIHQPVTNNNSKTSHNSDDPAETLDNLKLRHDELVKELESEKLRHASKKSEVETFKKRLGKSTQSIEKHRNRIAELEAKNEELEKSTASYRQRLIETGLSDEELVSKDEKIEQLEEKLKKAVKMIREKAIKIRRYDTAFDQCEEEIEGLEKQIAELEKEVDELKNEVARKDSALQELEGQCSKDVELLRERISSLESEIRHLRETSDLNLKKLEKAENELVKKDWYLSHLDHEKTKQLDAAKQNINALEKEVASYARRNTDLKAEIRSLKNRDEDQTITLMRGEEPSSAIGDNVGVVGSLALFTLNAKVDRLSRENEQLRNKAEMLQREVNELGIINADLKQRKTAITQKYESLRASFDGLHGTVEVGEQSSEPTSRVMRTRQIAEVDSEEETGTMQETEIESEKPRTTDVKENKENKKPLSYYERPDACKTQ